jgi:toxin-antitoxin system PIN domain toxin
VILVDANLLIYACNAQSPHHSVADAWLTLSLNGSTQVGLPWNSLLAFLRITTNPRAFANPASPADAWRQVCDWLARDNVWTPQPTARHPVILGELLTQVPVQGNFIMDTHLAALAIEHGLTLCTADSDFAKFPGLRWHNPLL